MKYITSTLLAFDIVSPVKEQVFTVVIYNDDTYLVLPKPLSLVNRELLERNAWARGIATHDLATLATLSATELTQYFWEKLNPTLSAKHKFISTRLIDESRNGIDNDIKKLFQIYDGISLLFQEREVSFTVVAGTDGTPAWIMRHDSYIDPTPKQRKPPLSLYASFVKSISPFCYDLRHLDVESKHLRSRINLVSNLEAKIFPYIYPSRIISPREEISLIRNLRQNILENLLPFTISKINSQEF